MFLELLINKFIPARISYDVKDWQIGDIVICSADVEGQFSKGTEYRISGITTHSQSDIIVHIESDDSGNPNGWGSDYFYWHGAVSACYLIEC